MYAQRNGAFLRLPNVRELGLLNYSLKSVSVPLLDSWRGAAVSSSQHDHLRLRRRPLSPGRPSIWAVPERAYALRTQSRKKLSLPTTKQSYALLKKRNIPSPITTRNKNDS